VPRATVLLWWAPFVVDASANVTFRFVTFYHLGVVLVCMIFQCNTFHFRWPLHYKNVLKRFRSVWSWETKPSTGESCVLIVGGVTSSLGWSAIVTGHDALVYRWTNENTAMVICYVGESLRAPLFNTIFIINCWLRGLGELSEHYQLFHLLSTS